MEKYYTAERNVQIILYLLKQYGIRKVVASPGTTNITLVASMQQDPFFEMYSAADERSAAYIACGLAAEAGEPVALSCTGATASRNYIPGLTEAYYRKLPVLAVTATQNTRRTGNLVAQVIDRSVVANDVAVKSFLIETVKDSADERDCEVKVNNALDILTSENCGPVHLNVETTYSMDFSVKELPSARVIRKYRSGDTLPGLPDGRIGIFVGSHKKWSAGLTEAVDRFCRVHDAVVFCDQTSNYKGPFRFLSSLVAAQPRRHGDIFDLRLMIHIGEISGDYSSGAIHKETVWRVNPDGEYRDTFGNLSAVFQMSEEKFFNSYASAGDATGRKEYPFIEACKAAYDEVYNAIPELPFSNIWTAMTMSKMLPEGAVLHLGILNTLRSWNFFEIPASVMSYANVGGFGIDGDMSSLIGASLADRERLFFGVLGDLAFFYDMNVLGNHHVGNNVRIMLINNGRGVEFRNYNHNGAMFGEDADKFIAAAGHYGNKSPELVRHYAEDLGYEYLCASDKESFLDAVKRFTTPEMTDRPMLLEVFTETQDESDALYCINNIQADHGLRKAAKQAIKNVLGEDTVRSIRSIIKK